MNKRVNAPQLGTKPRRTRDERVAWIQKDQGLYDWWQHSMCPIDKFMQDNRIQIDEQIDRAEKLEGH